MMNKISNDELNLTVELLDVGLMNIDDDCLLACRANTNKLIERWLSKTNITISVDCVNYIIKNEQFKQLTGYSLEQLEMYAAKYKHNQRTLKFVTHCQDLVNKGRMKLNDDWLELSPQDLFELTKYGLHMNTTIFDQHTAGIDIPLLDMNNDISILNMLAIDEIKPCE